MKVGDRVLILAMPFFTAGRVKEIIDGGVVLDFASTVYSMDSHYHAQTGRFGQCDSLEGDVRVYFKEKDTTVIHVKRLPGEGTDGVVHKVRANI